MKRILNLMFCLALMMPAASQPKIGLALGGGGAKGAAEVGVLKVLEEAGIKPDFIVGTSIGSIVGGLYAAGYTAAELETMFQTQEWLSLLTDRNSLHASEPYKTVDGITYIFGFPIYDREAKGFGVMKGQGIEHLLDSMVSAKDCTDFSQLKTPFRCVAADIRSGSEVILREGSLARAMRASMAIPGVFKPVEINGQKLVDGGMLNNLPVDICRQMGADIVIAVDLQQNEQKSRPQTDLSAIQELADLIGIGGILNWVTNRPDIEKYHTNRQQADILIRPSLPDADVTSLGNKKSLMMIERGIEAARKQLPQLTKLAQPQATY
jgi:NTE family protein